MAKKILIVDDDRLLLSYVSKRLEIAGYDTIALDSAEAVMDILQQHDISLVLLDILMEWKDGIETLVEIRQDYKDLPVVTISTNAKYLPASTRLGADATLHKPIRMPELLGLVESIVHH